MDKDAHGQYASVNGLNMYYEVHGAGRPLVLLHGALSAIGTSFGKVLPSLAKTRQVIAIEQQAHGHTADIDRPLTISISGPRSIRRSKTEAHGAVCDAGGPIVDASGPKRSTYAAWTSCQRSAGVHGASSSLR
jgi:pimeloyl-ACP methyl ester carboxylesterase